MTSPGTAGHDRDAVGLALTGFAHFPAATFPLGSESPRRDAAGMVTLRPRRKGASRSYSTGRIDRKLVERLLVRAMYEEVYGIDPLAPVARDASQEEASESVLLVEAGRTLVTLEELYLQFAALGSALGSARREARTELSPGDAWAARAEAIAVVRPAAGRQRRALSARVSRARSRVRTSVIEFSEPQRSVSPKRHLDALPEEADEAEETPAPPTRNKRRAGLVSFAPSKRRGQRGTRAAAEVDAAQVKKITLSLQQWNAVARRRLLRMSRAGTRGRRGWDLVRLLVREGRLQQVINAYAGQPKATHRSARLSPFLAPKLERRPVNVVKEVALFDLKDRIPTTLAMQNSQDDHLTVIGYVFTRQKRSLSCDNVHYRFSSAKSRTAKPVGLRESIRLSVTRRISIITDLVDQQQNRYWLIAVYALLNLFAVAVSLGSLTVLHLLSNFKRGPTLFLYAGRDMTFLYLVLSPFRLVYAHVFDDSKWLGMNTLMAVGVAPVLAKVLLLYFLDGGSGAAVATPEFLPIYLYAFAIMPLILFRYIRRYIRTNKRNIRESGVGVIAALLVVFELLFATYDYIVDTRYTWLALLGIGVSLVYVAVDAYDAQRHPQQRAVRHSFSYLYWFSVAQFTVTLLLAVLYAPQTTSSGGGLTLLQFFLFKAATRLLIKAGGRVVEFSVSEEHALALSLIWRLSDAFYSTRFYFGFTSFYVAVASAAANALYTITSETGVQWDVYAHLLFRQRTLLGLVWLHLVQRPLWLLFRKRRTNRVGVLDNETEAAPQTREAWVQSEEARLVGAMSLAEVEGCAASVEVLVRTTELDFLAEMAAFALIFPVWLLDRALVAHLADPAERAARCRVGCDYPAVATVAVGSYAVVAGVRIAVEWVCIMRGLSFKRRKLVRMHHLALQRTSPRTAAERTHQRNLTPYSVYWKEHLPYFCMVILWFAFLVYWNPA